MRHLKLVLLMSTTLATPSFAQEESTTELEPIVIEASKGGRIISTTAGDVDGYRALTATSSTLTDTPLREVPQSIQVLPRSVIDDQGITSIGEALKNASGAVGQSALQTPVYNSNYIRGFPAEIYIDGMTTYLQSGDPNSFADVERIEVLKGPSAILYGGGVGAPLGGVINVVSKLPTAERFAEIGGTIGSEGYYAPYFDINQPLNSEGTVLFRGTGTYVKSGSEVDVIDTDRYSFNPTLTLTNNEDTTLTLQGRFSLGAAGIPAPPRPRPCRRPVLAQSRPLHRQPGCAGQFLGNQKHNGDARLRIRRHMVEQHEALRKKFLQSVVANHRQQRPGRRGLVVEPV